MDLTKKVAKTPRVAWKSLPASTKRTIGNLVGEAMTMQTSDDAERQAQGAGLMKFMRREYGDRPVDRFMKAHSPE